MRQTSKSKKDSLLSSDQQQLDFNALSLTAEEGSVSSGPQTWTVSELTAYLQSVIENDPVLGVPVVVEGELSNVKRSSRGHVYFTLKDGKASINGILWASTVSRLKFDLEDGMAVYLTGKAEIYAPSGSYSLVGKKIEPVGIGSLQLAFQQIKEKLEAEGLFLEHHKKPIPEFPKRIGIITSKTGAVIHDMLRVIRQKNPGIHILIVPVAVQGDAAADEISQAIRRLNTIHRDSSPHTFDTIIVARGGGSFEDLFCFSQESVVRAIFDSEIPVVTGIGHEPDFGLADAVADYSAATPTAAADWTVPDIRLLLREHHHRGELLVDLMNDELLNAEYDLDQKATRFIELVLQKLAVQQANLSQVKEKLIDHTHRQLERSGQRLANLSDQLAAFSPLETLSRGYAIASDPQKKKVIRSVQEIIIGDALSVRLKDGQLECTVSSVSPASTL